MKVSAVTTDTSGRVISWIEGDYQYTVTRDTSGKPLYLRGSSPGRKRLGAEFRYTTAGLFLGMFGDDISSNLISGLVADANPTAGSAAVAAALGNMPSSGGATVAKLAIAAVSPARQAFAAAWGLRTMQSMPTIPETIPTKVLTGNRYYIDGGAAVNGSGTITSPFNSLATWIASIPNTGNGATVYLAGDGNYDYPETLTAYNAASKFPYNGCDNLKSTSAAAPTVIRPYHPRGGNATPTIRWYALLQASDWTQETGISPNVWSIPVAAAAGETAGDVLLVTGSSEDVCTPVYGNYSGGGFAGTYPQLLTGPKQYVKDANKVYLWAPSNPSTYYGVVKFSRNKQAVFSTFWNGLRNTKIFGLKFELCRAVTAVSADSANIITGTEIAYCIFNKSWGAYIGNQSGVASEMSFSFHDNSLTNSLGKGVHLDTTAANQKISWEVYRNTVNVGNLVLPNGALLYNQCPGGTKHHAWGNYGYDCRNGTGDWTIDGAFIYHDVSSNVHCTYGNIAERCGLGFQSNNAIGSVTIGNLAIDCIQFGLFTGAADISRAGQTQIVAHNTYLWTGRVSPSDIPHGSGVLISNAVFGVWNDNWSVFGNKWVNFVFANNLTVCVDTSMAGRAMLTYNTTEITTSLVAGNASAGLGNNGTGLVLDKASGSYVDVTATAEFMSRIGPASAAGVWLLDPANGVARPAPASPLAGMGVPLNQQYVDLAGNNFSTVPTPGCFEIAAA